MPALQALTADELKRVERIRRVLLRVARDAPKSVQEASARVSMSMAKDMLADAEDLGLVLIYILDEAASAKERSKASMTRSRSPKDECKEGQEDPETTATLDRLRARLGLGRGRIGRNASGRVLILDPE